ncbi:MAG TPA: leucine--tRNA ligase [Candidatus Saccharimonadales bacterium]
MKRYNPKEIEPRWQAKWLEDKTFDVHEDSDKPKQYIIDMFPYPSGAAMHVGHVRNFTISDVLSQFHRQKGYNVLHTMGWDTFGLPAENYAIKTGTPPAQTTKTNIANFKHQLQQLGMSYDWSREINTSDPEYYKWTQWIFTQLFEHGLAYQAERAQWWCNECKTVLANEQVINGCCWRHEDTPVVKKLLKQWFFKITAYADELLEDIDTLDWPEKIKTMQRNWIGKSHGIIYKNKVRGTGLTIESFSAHFEAFTANTFVAIAPDHPLLARLVEGLPDAEAVLEKAQDLVHRRDALGEKGADMMEGIFTGRYAIDNFGDEDLPIWATSYALGDYGTGIVLCSAHDERDFAFAKKYDIRLKPTMVPIDPAEAEKVRNLEYCFSDMEHGILIDPPEFAGRNAHENREAIITYLEKHGYAQRSTTYKMRDWLISRQRYWGAPIPIVFCEKHGAVAVPEKDLPVLLPEVDNFAPTGKGSVLANVPEWVNTTCPTCGGPAKRETDTMDGYACSSWYFLRYIDPHNAERAWDPAKAAYWMPVDYYCGGDHAVSHLLYSRFWFHFFARQGWVEKSAAEPVKRLVYNGYILAPDGTKMSKSKGNTINPDDLIEQGYGADSVRLFEMFIAPYEQNTSWNTHGVPGTYRFLQRTWTLVQEFLAAGHSGETAESEAVLRVAHRTIKRVTTELDSLGFNTAVAAMMESVNDLFKLKAADGYAAGRSWRFALESLLQVLAPFAPHITEELWRDLGHQGSIHRGTWPTWDEHYLAEDTVTIAVQVNGKVRGEVTVAPDAPETDAVAAARGNERARAYIDGKDIIKVIYVPGKILNLVLK